MANVNNTQSVVTKPDSQLVKNVLPTTLISVRVGNAGSPWEFLPVTFVAGLVQGGREVYVPVLWAGNFAARRIVACTQKTVKALHKTRTFKCGSERVMLHESSSVIVQPRSSFGFEVRSDETVWSASLRMKDGFQISVAKEPTGSRIYDLETLQISKAGLSRGPETLWDVEIVSKTPPSLVAKGGIIFC